MIHFEDSTGGDAWRGVLQIFQISAPRQGFLSKLRMVLSFDRSVTLTPCAPGLWCNLSQLVESATGVANEKPEKRMGNKCVEKTELANIKDWESKFRASNPVRSWCFCHETSKSFDDVGGASILLPCSLEKDRFLKNEPHAVAAFLSLYTLRRDQSETASE